jgi:ABC-type spermidine/putrescine transport system permease subunit II
VLFSFHSTPALSFPFEGFSLRWYDEVLGTEQFRQATINSLVVAVSVGLTTLVLGTAAAHAVTRVPRRLRRVVTLLLFLPVAVPGLFLGLALLILFNRVGATPSLVTVAMAHWVYVLPYFMLIALQAFASLDPDVEELARDLGASSWQIFWKVTLPQIWPLLAGAAMLAFVLSFDEFIITFFVIGPDPTLPLFVWSSLRRSVDPSINVISTLLLAVSLGIWVITLLLVLRREAARKVAVNLA